MKISVLISDLTDNPIVRAYPILKVLEKRYEIDVVGPCFGPQIFKPYGNEFKLRVFEGCNYPRFFKKIRDICNNVNGDILFTFKPRPTSYLIGLVCSFLKHIPLVLDIEDWELAPYFIQQNDLSRCTFFRRYILHGWKTPNDFKYLYLTEKLIPLSTIRFVSSNFLKERFGGIKVYHGVDTGVFDPERYNKRLLREKWGIPRDGKIVLFAGTPRPHKGLDDLIRALNIIDANGKIYLFLVGGSIEGNVDPDLFELYRQRIIHLGYQPHALMPEILHLSDLVILPQKDNPISRAQVPAKVFEAMAMAKPIISTAISDLPEILRDCGIVIGPGDIEALAKNIRFILANPWIGRMMGKKARKKCIELYNYEAMARILIPVFQSLEDRLYA